MNRTRLAALLITAPLLFTAGVSALGAIFDYPEVLKRPAAEILGEFSASEGAVISWFLVLALAAGLLMPIAIGVGRLADNGWMRASVWVGSAAAVVQVIGLLRWAVLLPGFAADAASGDPAVVAAAEESFRTAHRILGNMIGETLGYLLTTGWTLLVLVALGRTMAGRWFTVLGATAAVLVLSGVLSPLDLPLVDTANLVGYVLSSSWLLAFAVLLLRGRPGRSDSRATEVSATPAQARRA